MRNLRRYGSTTDRFAPILGSINPTHAMPLIQIENTEFINPDHIVRMVYRPEDTRIEETIDKDLEQPKKVESKVDSSITVRLSDGYQIDRSGLAADELYQKLTGEEPPKIRTRKRAVTDENFSEAGIPPRTDQSAEQSDEIS